VSCFGLDPVTDHSDGPPFPAGARRRADAAELLMNLSALSWLYPFYVPDSAGDTYVMKGAHNNFSTEGDLKLGTFDGGDSVDRVFLNFPGVAALAGKTINSATLKLYENHSWSCSPRDVEVYRVTEPWNGTDLWDFPGAATGEWITTAGFAMGYCGGGWASFDVHSAVANWASGAWGPYGLMLKAFDENDNYNWKKFNSYDAGGSSVPVIEVAYTDPAPPGNRAPNIPTTVRPGYMDHPVSSTPAVSAVYSDPDGHSGAVAFWLYNEAGQVVWAEWSPLVTNGSVASRTITAKPDGWYFVRAIAHDGQVYSADWSPAGQWFFIDTRPPNNPTSLTPANGSSVNVPSQATAVYSEPYNYFAGCMYFWLTDNPSGTNPLTIKKEGWDDGCMAGRATAPGGTSTFALPLLSDGTYRVYAMAYKAGLLSAQVGPNTFTVLGSTPDVPRNITAAPGNGSATVAWNPPIGNGAVPVDAYNLLVFKTTPTVTFVRAEPTLCGTCTSTTVSNLINGQGYQFHVSAHNAKGNGPYGASNVVTPGTSPDLLAPTAVVATGGDKSATLSWTAPVTRLLFPVSYTIYTYRASDNVQLPGPTSVAGTTDATVTATVSGLTNGISVYFRVTATTLIFLTSPPSAPSNTVTPAGPPFAPVSVSATRGDTTATLTWPTPDNNGEAITGYEVAVVNPVTGAELEVRPVAQSPAEIGGLANGTRYAFRVRAINATGIGPYSPLSNTVIPAGPPFPPENVTASPGNRDATVRWNPPSTRGDGTPGDNGEPITSYVLTVSPGGQTLTTDGAVTTATVSGLDNGTLYVFRVTANNALGASHPASASAIPAAPPTTPTNVVASPGDGYAVVEWSPSSPTGVPVTYTVVASPGGRSVSTMSTSAMVDGLTNGQEYTFTVQARNSAGTSGVSAPSNPVTPLTATPPPPSSQCQTSTLPPPPGEVRLESGAVKRRIDVPCMPALHGRVRMGFFIMDEEVHFLPDTGVAADGDGRGFDPAMGPEDNRIYIEIDYTTGTGFVEANKSCKTAAQTDCKPANTLVGNFTSVTRNDGAISIEFSIGNSQAEDTPIFNNLEISADFDIVPMPGGALCVMGTASQYPAIEAYYDKGSQTLVLLQEPQSPTGAFIGLALWDRGIRGCA
jgi:hypothetical protein